MRTASSSQLEKARDLDPTIPSVWNNLANYYGEHGPTTNAFICYEKAIKLDPTESVYYHNFGTTVYLYRKDVKEYYHINEQQVFDKAMGLYAKATNWTRPISSLASDVAMSYYGIKPLRTNDALAAWTNALSLAHDEIEREGVYIHFARIECAGRNVRRRAQAPGCRDERHVCRMKLRVGADVERARASGTRDERATGWVGYAGTGRKDQRARGEGSVPLTQADSIGLMDSIETGSASPERRNSFDVRRSTFSMLSKSSSTPDPNPQSDPRHPPAPTRDAPGCP